MDYELKRDWQQFRNREDRDDDSDVMRDRVYTQVLDGSVRDAVEKIGGELFTIVHRPGQADAVTD